MINKCLSCGAKLPPPLLVLENMPEGAQVMPDKEGLKDDAGISLPLCRCRNCGLAQFDVQPPDYYKSAIRVVGLSETMRNLRRDDYRHILNTYGLSGKKWVELGCGNGDFLKVLSEFPVEIYGTEESGAYVKEAASKVPGARIFNFFPDHGNSPIPGAPFDCFLSFNFLEHQPDPRAMFSCLWNSLSPGGIGLITVPSLEYILDNGRYYELIRDHIANYDIGSLGRLLESTGFDILEKGYIGIGDTLRLVVRKNEGPDIRENPSRAMPDGFIDKKILDLKGDYEKTKKDMEAFVKKLEASGRSLCLWGAGHQCFTLAATTVLCKCAKYIIDSSPKKQGRYAPASHLPIISPAGFFENPADVIMITAPGYIPEIESGIRNLYGTSAACSAPLVCDILNLALR